MKVALVYDRVNKWGGAEQVLMTLHEMFPTAPLFTSVANIKTARWAKVFPKIVPSFLQNFPFAKKHHDWYPWLMPIAFETLNLGEFDLVISVTSEFAKGIITKPETLHICYCLTPTRYLWSGYNEYFNSPQRRLLARPLISYLLAWDKVAAQRPDVMIGISKAIVVRIKNYYDRDAHFIYPPVNISKFSPLDGKKSKGKYFLVVSRLVPYKRIDLAVKVFNQLKWPLVIVGTGSEEKKLRSMAKHNIKFTGFVSETELKDYYLGCKALIMPQEEDFGIAAVEAQAAGKPVITYQKGGAKEIITKKTGLFFKKQTQDSLVNTLQKFNPLAFHSRACRENARRFSKENFMQEFDKLIFAKHSKTE